MQKVSLFAMDAQGACCGALPQPGVFLRGAVEANEPSRALHPFSVAGGDVRVNKLVLDLERRGRLLVACAAVGAHRAGHTLTWDSFEERGGLEKTDMLFFSKMKKLKC